jgi:hypothetical protein
VAVPRIQVLSGPHADVVAHAGDADFDDCTPAKTAFLDRVQLEHERIA